MVAHDASSGCRVCGAPVSEVMRSTLPYSVSSACVIVPTTTRIMRCGTCGLLQKTAADVVADYREYHIFNDNPMGDKIVRKAGFPDRTRAQCIADVAIQRLRKRPTAKILEIGCHRGAFLKALQALMPKAELHGFDINPDYARLIEPIIGKNHYHHGALATMTESFDVCVLIHTLEHVVSPGSMLSDIANLLKKNGEVWVVVPDIENNPSDIYTVDHTCHFDHITLLRTLNRAGFSAHINQELIPNELVAFATPALSKVTFPTKTPPSTLSTLTPFERGVSMLPAMSGYVFGTAMMGALLAACLGDRCIGFADESPFRVNSTFQGKPVHHPKDLAGKTLFLGVAENVAHNVTPRLLELGLDIINPWVIGRA